MSDLPDDFKEAQRYSNYFRVKRMRLSAADLEHKTFYDARNVPVIKWLRENPDRWKEDGDRDVAILILDYWGFRTTTNNKNIHRDSTTNKELAQTMIDNIQKPPGSYVKSCKDLATDDYWKWIMSNPNQWTGNDRNHVIWHINERFGLRTKYADLVRRLGNPENEWLYMMLQDCMCDAKVGPGNCSCTKGMNRYLIEKLEYDKKIAENLAISTNIEAAKNNYNNVTLPDWNSRRADKLSKLTNELWKHTRCGTSTCKCSGGTGCQTEGKYYENKAQMHGWYKAQSENCNTVFNKRPFCKRTQAQIDADIAEWETANPKPNPPSTVLKQVDIPTSNIVCCGINFSDMTADEIEITDVQQNCSLEVNENDVTVLEGEGIGAIGGNAAPSSSARDPKALDDDDDDDDEDNTTMYIIIAVIIILLCCSCSSALSSILGAGGFVLTR